MSFKNNRSITEELSIYSLMRETELTTSPIIGEEDSEPVHKTTIYMDLYTSDIGNKKINMRM